MSDSDKDTDFMSELQAASRITPSTPVMAMFFSIVALIVLAFIWASVSKVEKITRGQGQVVPTQEIKYVQSLEGGILEEVLVTQGQKVKSGDVLLRISDIQFSSDARGTAARSLGLQLQKTRLEAEARGKEFIVPENLRERAPNLVDNEISLYRSRQAELKNAYQILDDRISKANADLAETQAQINRLYQNRKLLNQELAMTREMVKKRAVPKLDQIRLERELSDISGQINALSQGKKALAAEVKVAKTERESQVDTFRSQALAELNKVETEITGLEEKLKSIGDRVDRAEIKSPVDGIINNISINTIGGVVEPAKPLMEIVPIDDELKITAKIPPGDIGFLRVNQPVKVKITAYDAQIYGALEGKVIRIGANASPNSEGEMFFEIDVKTTKNFIGDESSPLPITPGMEANVEVITGKRTIMEYLLKPIFRARERAFTER